MAEACATTCDAFKYCVTAESLRGSHDYFAIAHEAIESCIAPIINDKNLCYVVLESDLMLGRTTDDRPEDPPVKRFA